MSRSKPTKQQIDADHPVWRWLLEHAEPIWIPVRIDLSDAVAPARALSRVPPPPPRRPSKHLLPQLVRDAQSAITFDGGNAKRPPPKRQHIDKTSYAYGVLWGVASALDCSLGEALDRYGKAAE